MQASYIDFLHGRSCWLLPVLLFSHSYRVFAECMATCPDWRLHLVAFGAVMWGYCAIILWNGLGAKAPSGIYCGPVMRENCTVPFLPLECGCPLGLWRHEPNLGMMEQGVVTGLDPWGCHGTMCLCQSCIMYFFVTEITSILRNNLILTTTPFMCEISLPVHLSDNLVEFRIKPFIPQNFQAVSSCLLASSIVSEKSVLNLICNTIDMTF